ncbi:unnamed protein product, partial [Rotaria sp. Silwood1]
FFYRIPEKAVEYSGESGRITHGDDKAYDACRYYGALIVAALRGALKDELISDKFYEDHKQWFGKKPLHTDILKIAQGSYKKSGGYNEGIRGKGYVVSALEAALWAFWSDNNSFEKGALKAVNLGDDTDTTAAIYGQLAGAVYGYQNLPNKWCKRVYAKNFICHVSNWIVCEGIINDNEEHFAHFGKDDPNEDYDHPEHSVTQNCKSYTFDTDYGHKLRIIDTPGRSSDHPKMSCEEGWSISKKSWDRLLEYTHKSLSPYFIRQECNKVEYFRLKTMGMIRPMLESMRNILRNGIINKDLDSPIFVELRPKPISHPSALCYSCKPNVYRHEKVSIPYYVAHKYIDECYDCSCKSSQHVKIDYLLEYE